MKEGRKSLVVGMVLVVLLVLCSGAAWSGGGQEGGAAAKMTTVKVILFAGGEASAARKAFEKFNTQYSQQMGIRVESEEFGRDTYYDKMGSLLLTKSKDFDALMMLSSWLSTYAAAGVVEPLDGYVSNKKLLKYNFADFLPRAVDTCKYKGKLYGLPYVTSSQFMMYRADYIKDASVLSTTQGVYDTAKRFTQRYNSSSPTKYGFAMQGKMVTYQFANWLWAFGGDFIVEGKPVFNSPAGVQALTFIRKLIAEGLVPDDWSSYEYPQINDGLKTGAVGFAQQWDAGIFDLKATLGDKIAVADFPQGPTGAKGAYIHCWQFWINGSAANKQEAFKVLSWLLLDPESYAILGEEVPLSTTKVLGGSTYQGKTPSWASLYNNVQVGRFFPNVVSWGEVMEKLHVFLQKAYAGELSPKDALDQAAAEATRIMKKNNEYTE